ncbi:flagellar hook-length control protein FliK [Bradyrhizobium sp. ISRA443]|uniref:flagellar hook-length control protein FliK n=1 Tax=unclassified Bradyrhizobium TaxID=2631580 RepID=UPI00247AAC22|nr:MULTISPECIES: flagellar hook-length control protein FliK [unclassified Bradyrhizobium]WGS01983.1 flagellar hook-length control protein FliK [Bradyrhizobium sp. ISRA436]WGS08868.1 flagellar hook-length control protein FliK [Bradyrhizobium sp. ISRA437]WGS15757.1 flagellar hook-length control protein FliK [Bradyrhizobium sp. ISRA443]
MAITINPVLPVLAPQAGSIAPDLTLQAGSVVNAEVLKILSADLVRIAIASLAIDVQTEVPLQQGQNLQLAVLNTQDGVRLQLVGSGGGATGTPGDAVKLSPAAMAGVGDASPLNTTASQPVLTPLERVAVTAAMQSAATAQGSQGPLFANLAAIASANLPPKLQAAVAQVLAQQTNLDDDLSGDAVKAAFQKSGVLFEASLASGAAPPAGTVPDLKAALIVLRQTLHASLGTADAARPASAPLPQEPTLPNLGTAPGLAPPAMPDLEVIEILLPQARVPVAEDLTSGGASLVGALADALDGGPSPGGALNLLQEALHELDGPVRHGAGPQDMPTGDVARTNTPPPPFRGALPVAQAMAEPSIAPDAPLSTVAHRLMENTDAALARQTLLQVASLPDGGDALRPQIDAMTPRWNFEIPFLTAQGTAMAQFEISRDGGGEAIEATKRAWRARFTLDIEPAGPVHALVSLSGDTTSVRMWAERPLTAAQLRAGATELSQALARSELTPGEIEIRDGAPPQATPARAGHFLDRAL